MYLCFCSLGMFKILNINCLLNWMGVLVLKITFHSLLKCLIRWVVYTIFRMTLINANLWRYSQLQNKLLQTISFCWIIINQPRLTIVGERPYKYPILRLFYSVSGISFYTIRPAGWWSTHAPFVLPWSPQEKFFSLLSVIRAR